jgi:hypothetical protein
MDMGKERGKFGTIKVENFTVTWKMKRRRRIRRRKKSDKKETKIKTDITKDIITF